MSTDRSPISLKTGSDASVISGPMFFVSVRAELDEPVVLREIRRVTDELRDQPGVANAWSVADLFMGVTLQGDVASRIPDDPEQVRRILVQARTDPAVRLELAGDHREALIAVRFDDDPTIDHLSVVARLETYLATELRRALLRVDLGAPGVSPVKTISNSRMQRSVWMSAVYR